MNQYAVAYTKLCATFPWRRSLDCNTVEFDALVGD